MSWGRIRGHEALVESFQRAVCRGRLAHAYLFAGPEGVGKRLFAGELAKALLCAHSTDDYLEACDRCPDCLQVEAGTHPDLFVTGRPEDSLDVPIEVMRELCRSFSLKSARGRGKVVILDDADDLNEASANSFLKTLEEPPARSILLLIGTSPERQLATVVSRCQVVRFAPLPAPAIAELLREQGVDDPQLIERLIRLSGGSLGQARALAEPELWAFRRKLLDDLTQTRPDSVALANSWMRFVEEAGKETASQRRRAALVLRLIIEFLNDALTLSLGGTPKPAEPADLDALRKLGERTGTDRLLEVLERCLQSDEQIDRRVQLVLVLEALMDALGEKLRV